MLNIRIKSVFLKISTLLRCEDVFWYYLDNEQELHQYVSHENVLVVR